MLPNVCKQNFHTPHVRISQKVNSVLMWNLQLCKPIFSAQFWFLSNPSSVARFTPIQICIINHVSYNYIYKIMKVMYSPGYHNIGLIATCALQNMINCALYAQVRGLLQRQCDNNWEGMFFSWFRILHSPNFYDV